MLGGLKLVAEPLLTISSSFVLSFAVLLQIADNYMFLTPQARDQNLSTESRYPKASISTWWAMCLSWWELCRLGLSKPYRKTYRNKTFLSKPFGGPFRRELFSNEHEAKPFFGKVARTNPDAACAKSCHVAFVYAGS